MFQIWSYRDCRTISFTLGRLTHSFDFMTLFDSKPERETEIHELSRYCREREREEMIDDDDDE